MPFGGKPLLAWSVALAKSCSRVARCVVTTESEEIAAVARSSGAEVVERPVELAGDDSPIVDVLIHAAETVRSQGTMFDGVMLLQPTNPLRPIDMTEQAISRFESETCHSLIAVSRRQLKMGAVVNGRFAADYAPGTQSRHARPIYYENGLLYITRTDILLDRRSIYGDDVLACETERPFDEVDIDEPVDHLVGEAILNVVRDRLGYA